MSRTHIWPDWLGRLLPFGDAHSEESKHSPAFTAGSSAPTSYSHKMKQGSVFSLKPFVACETCNTGWMAKFEDEMVKFSKPIFTSNDPLRLNDRQVQILSVWLSLIVILAEYIKLPGSSIAISAGDRNFIRSHLTPPENWSIFYASLNSTEWRQKYKRHVLSLNEAPFGVLSPILFTDDNTQISSLGMGKIFVQVFTCPVDRIVTDYRIAARARGLSQLWPITGGFWPFTKGSAKFPTKLVLDDDEAEIVADAFHERMRIMLRSAHRGARLY